MSLRRAVLVGWLMVIMTGGCAPQTGQVAGRATAPAQVLASTDSVSTANATAPASKPAAARTPVPAVTSIPTPTVHETATAAATGSSSARVLPLTSTTAEPRSDTVTPLTPTPAQPGGDTATPVMAESLTRDAAPDGVQRQVHVPILMYHYVSVPPAGADAYRKDLSVSPEQFDRQLAYLKDSGYHVITLDDLRLALTHGQALPEKPVILTFDDGYADNYANAFPLLQKYGYVAQFFIITDFVNQGRPEYMSWKEIEEMAATGQRFGSHSRDHPNLRGKSTGYLVWQALGGMEAIQEHLGYHPRWIAYPSGAYDAQTIDVFKSANYWGGLTTQQGATHKTSDLFELSRVRVRGSYTVEDLERVLNAKW